MNIRLTVLYNTSAKNKCQQLFEKKYFFILYIDVKRIIYLFNFIKYYNIVNIIARIFVAEK